MPRWQGVSQPSASSVSMFSIWTTRGRGLHDTSSVLYPSVAVDATSGLTQSSTIDSILYVLPEDDVHDVLNWEASHRLAIYGFL